MSILTGIALSVHLGLDHNYNGFHPYIRYYNQDFISGVFYNSENRIGFYAGLNKKLSKDFSVDLGIVTGYKSADILPMVRFIHDKSGMFITPGVEVSYDNIEKIGVVFGVQF